MSRSSLRFLLLVLLVLPETLHAQLTQDQNKLLSKKPLIRKIHISGNHSYSEGKIRKILYSREDGFWQKVGLMRANRFTKRNLYNDPVLLGYFYTSHGFIDAKVTEQISEANDSLGIDVLVNIEEGPRYKIQDIIFSGDVGNDLEHVRGRTSDLKVGDYADQFMIKTAQQNITEYYANRGYPYAEVRLDVGKHIADSTLVLTFDVTRGILVVFGDIVLDTTLSTRKRVFDHEVVFHKSELYSRDKFFESQQRLIRTNLFSYVSLNKPDSMTHIDSLMPSFRVRAIERPPRFVNLAVGAAQDKEQGYVLNLTGAFGNRSIQGSARKVRLESISSFQAVTNWEFVRQNFEFTYTEPYLFRIRMPFIFSFSYQPGVRSLIQKYRIQTISVDATLVREFTLYDKLAVSGNYEQFKIFDVPPLEVERYKEEQGINISRKLIFQFEQDTRPIDNKFNPPRGSYTQYRFEFVGGFLGGDNSFRKLLYNWSKYNVFSGNGVLATRLRLGWVAPFGSSNAVPSKERFYLGGAYTIRGFSENDFGPHDANGDPDGGESFGLVNLELRKPLFKLGWQIWGSYFIDSGLNVRELRLLALREIAVTTGVGTQIVSPVGPIRFDYGRRTTINNYPSGGTFHFGILYAF